MRRMFVEEIPPVGSEIQLPKREAEHLFKVLRAKDGEEFALLDGRGTVGSCTVTERKTLLVSARETAQRPREFHLFFALPRRNKLDQLLPQLAEVNVSHLHPVICERSVAESTPNERWILHLQEGCKQSGNPFLPEIAEPVKLAAALDCVKNSGIAGFYGDVTESDAVPPALDKHRPLGWLVGPEGGFTANETALMRQSGVVPLNIGCRVMRLETAAVCGAALLQYIYR